ncbi:MAG TPA: IclR family transcriptional regulator C-terminal domain-containing protein, partial [Acetobacteraceae bacterium]|nr:IclR family transcriptional regulator C-terminal domain-containing protein [Acetobacteraceae bacterium]
VPRATVYRLLRTLQDEGYVARSSSDDRFRLRLKVRSLSEGFEDEHWIGAVAAPALLALTQRILWPCDLATLEGTRMVIRETTHRSAPLSIDRNMVGVRLPLLESSTGLVYLAFAPEAERTALLRLLAASQDPEDALARDPAAAARRIIGTRRRGYGLRQGGPLWPHTGSIALPLQCRERVVGCVAVIWMARAIKQEEGVRRCLEPLRGTASEIEAGLAAEAG